MPADPDISLLFTRAVDAIDAGDREGLHALLESYPQLVHQRGNEPERGYFAHPYLLWFVADNPIRHEKLPSNIVDITATIIEALRQNPGNDDQLQLDYTLGLVATGRIPKECGVQIPLMDLLISSGARVKGSVLGPIGQHNFEAAKYLLDKGSEYDLATAVGLGRLNDVQQLVRTATPSQLYVALVVASYFGKPDLVSFLLKAGADPNGSGTSKDFGGFHSHASALHQAVFSGSVDAVRLLVEAGADLNALDKGYQGTPLGWAMYMQAEEADTDAAKEQFATIARYLKSQSPAGEGPEAAHS